MRLNEIRDTFAKLLGDFCKDFEIEPKFQPLEGETFDNKSTRAEDKTRLDFKANEHFLVSFCRTFFDVKRFNPSICSVRNKFKKHPNITKIQRSANTSKVSKRALLAHSSLRLQKEPERSHRKLSQDLRSSSATKLPSHTLM